jgi:PEP-CTERM putative exosortase interaction domain
MHSRIARTCVLAVTAIAASVPSAHALNILFVASSDDAGFQSYLGEKFADVSWTHMTAGTGDNQIGGTLDATRSFGGDTMTVRSYLESFDLVIIGSPNASAQFQFGSEWATITSPVLVANALVARALSGRLGLFSGDNVQNPLTFGSENETVRTSNTPLSDRIFAGVIDPTNLYLKADTDAISSIATSGAGDILARFGPGTANGNSVTNSYAVAYWTAGQTTGGGFTSAADRAYIAMKGGFNVDFTDDGKLVVANLVSELTGVSQIPEPASFAALAGLGALGLAATRRRRQG